MFKHFVTILAVTQCLETAAFPIASRLLLFNKSMERGDGTFREPDTIKNRPIGLWKMYGVKLLVDL